tara:strand:- start:3098 stop:4138 length:1041 start_codon:yes stop_codon:yes gene_type:complete
MKSILITGGAGFIGSHTAISLLDKDYRLTIIDSLINSSYKTIERLNKLYPKNQINFHKGDIRDIFFLKKIFKNAFILGHPIDYVIHFAGLKSVADSFSRKDKYWDINVNGTKNLLQVMAENKCFKIVFSSSASVYSQEVISPIGEGSKVEANNPYGETKLEVERILEVLQKSDDSDWKIICLRYFNPIGAHSSGFLGEDPTDKPNNLFPLLCQAANQNGGKLYIYGRDWPTPDGTCIRDYIHVQDLAEGHVASLEFLKKENQKSLFVILNLGTGKGTSVLNLINIFEKVNNVKVNFQFSERRIGDKAIVYADINKALELINWKPQKTIEDMCKDGWKWNLKKIFQN